MFVLYMELEGCEFSEEAWNDFTHIRALILRLGKLLDHIQSHYHHPTVEFDTIEVPLPPNVVFASSKNPNPLHWYTQIKQQGKSAH